MSLNELKAGKRGVVVRVDGGCCKRDRLFDLGIVPGVPVRVVHDGGSGSLVIEVLGSRVMLGRGMADSVVVA